MASVQGRTGRVRLRVTDRRVLMLLALGVQALVLVVGWMVTFRIVQRSFAGVIEAQVLEQNRKLAATIAELFPEEATAAGTGGVPFKSESWERLQKVIETDALRDLPAGGFACLIEPDGRVLCHPEIRADPGIRKFSFAGMELRATVDGLEAEPVLSAGAIGEFATGVVDFALGNTHFVATAPLGNSGLRLLVHQPIDALLRVGQESTGSVLGVAAVVLVTVLAVTGGGLAFLLRRYDGVHEQLNRQLQENLRTAKRIQESTLPTAWPATPGYGVAAWSGPAEETGGDTFDVVGLREHGAGYELVEDGAADRIALVLADATGHGVGPAIAVTQLQAMARVAWRMTRGLVGVVDLLSERLAASLPEGRFITAWFAALDPVKHEVEMFSAGQGPVLRVTAAGEVAEIESDSLPLGIMAGRLGGSRTVAMAPGDLIVVVSDGFVEAVDGSGAQFGTPRLRALVSAERWRDAGGIAGAIRAAVDAHSGGVRGDDQTLLVIKREAAT